MKSTSPFILFLGSLLSLSLLEANAIPLSPGHTGIITLPLKRIPTRQDIHPQLLFQQHINRSHRRLARMTGREEPSAKELLGRLVSREAHLSGRGSPRVGHAGAVLGNRGNPGKTSRAAADTGFNPIDDLKGLLDDAAASTGFSPVDLKALLDDTVTPANKPTAANSLALDDIDNDVGYLATVQMGTPPRDFQILMDSGSADFWVGAEGCKSAEGADCGNHTFLGTQSSTSFVDTKKPFQVTYGKGAVAGNITTDNIAIAGLQLTAHTFGVALQETDDFTTSKFDGLMGLAKSTLSAQQTLTPVEALAKAGSIKDAIVSYKISRLADQKNDGEITFGGLDPSKFDQATLVALPNVNTQGFWEAAMDAVTADGKDLGLTGRTAILDTGTTLIVAPPADAQAIHKAIPGSKSDGNGGFVIPCTTNTSIALSFGGKSFAIDPRDIAFVPVDPNNPTGDCASGIASGQIGGPQQLLVGDVFLKNAYFSTNVGQDTIQLAKLT
ncbi:aspartic peptidase A1 [Lactarius pseudohatsudake]|nr:aspartic peptidase A1 [Lactarius pseudohatsudake]